jgi:8-amino-7-oxononanoate synthase
MSLQERWSKVLEDLRRQGRYRAFAVPQGLDFTSNDYLGYGARFIQQTEQELPRSGMASRLLRGHHPIWEEVEATLCRWHNAEAALMMNSGYVASEGLLSTLLEPGDWVASDELNHACIVDGLRLARCQRFSYRHNDLNHLEDGLKTQATKRTPERERFILTEALFSMDGDCAPLPEIVELAEKYGASVIVDEAHSTGCFGSNGSGCVDAAGLRPRVLATLHTGGKALGVPGAYFCGSQLLKEYLINRCRHLIFTTALPAQCGLWWLEMLRRVPEDHTARTRLCSNATLLHQQLANSGLRIFGHSYIVPAILGDDVRAVQVAKTLQAHGFDVRAIRPPSVPPGTARLRISVHADQEPETLIRLAAVLRENVQVVADRNDLTEALPGVSTRNKA